VQLPPIPVHEEARLAALRPYDLSKPFSKDAYEPVMQLARDLFEVPTAFVSFVERDRQVFVVRSGLAFCETSRDVSFCAHAIAREELLVVLDATLDPCFSDNPLVTGEPFIRFYAGVPLISPSGHAIGTLCIVDTTPHSAFDETARRQLRDLASMVLDKLELRRLELARQAGQARFENISAASPDGIVCVDQEGVISFWNSAAERLFGHSADDAIGRSVDLIMPEWVHSRRSDGMHEVASVALSHLVGRTVELEALHRGGTEFPIELSLSMWHENGVASFGAIIRDISERRANEERLFKLAHHDPLTELPNRAVLRSRIDQLARGTGRASVLILDLDGFKDVNDGFGHSAGDIVLKQVAKRLLGCVRATDIVARLGGDEFALLLLGVGDYRHACTIADSAIQAIAKPIVLDGQTITVGASVGIAVYPGDSSSADDLLSNADLALYQAKAEGRQCHRIFAPALRQAADRARAHENELRRGYEREEFEIFYQPQVRLSDGALVGAEALLRWRHPEHGLLAPAAFITALERRPLSAQVGEWVLRTACAQASAWRTSGAQRFRIGVNLFGSQFRTGDLAGKVQAALADTGLPASGLELEITENIILNHDEGMIRPLVKLRDAGVNIAFDDYGTGYASLSMLKRFPITRLKVDQGFVRGMCGSAADAAIVHAVLSLGRSFGLGTIAEGVETEEQAETLRKSGCEEMQGYLFGRPMPTQEFSNRFGLARSPVLASVGA